jgi:RecB family exonuclease
MAKQFAWSYSKYKAFDSCPKRFYETSIAKNFVEESEQLQWGTDVHEALHKATIGEAPLPDSMREYQKWVDEMKEGEGTLYVEQQYAITKDFQPTEWYANDVWFRGICDVLRVSPSGRTALARDYKTGKVQHDSRQLMLMAQCLFIHHLSLRRIKTEFIWLKDDCTTVETFDRDNIVHEWMPLMPMVKRMEEAHVTMDYPPKPCGLCARWCPVVSCSFHGKRYRAA